MGILWINYSIDPARLFHDQHEKRMAELLLSGSNVATSVNYDDRLLQKHYISHLQKSKEVVVLGSSRTMLIRSNLFPGTRFMNNSVSGASIEDLLAIYELYSKKKIHPSILIIGLDPWLLNKNSGQDRWQILSFEWMAVQKKMNENPKLWMTWLKIIQYRLKKQSEIISPSYTQESLRMFLREGWKETVYYPTMRDSEDLQVKHYDGSVSYDIKMRSKTIQEVQQDAIGYAREGDVYALENFTQLNPVACRDLELFLDLVKKDGVQVYFLLAPYHPETYKRLISSPKYQIIHQAQNYFTGLAAKRRIPLLGSYNPSDCSLGEEDFFDGMHPKQIFFDKTFKEHHFLKN
jgi:hypothetical protein